MYYSTGRSNDLCYYMHDGPDAFRFELTGRLSEDAARDLERAWRTAASTIGKRRVIIDLSGLTGISRDGHELLDRWAGEGAQLAVVNHRAATRLQPMIDRPVTVLTAAAVHTTGPLARAALWCAVFLTFASPTNAATLKQETVNVWEDYIQNANVQIQDRVKPGRHFLCMDESGGRAAKVRKGEVVVWAAGASSPREIPSGLIHDWIGAVYIANTTLDQVLPIVRDYARYKDYFRPAVIDSKVVALGDTEDSFSMILANKAPFRKIALNSLYKSSQVRVDDARRYTVAQTTRIQEIAEYGSTSQHLLPEGEGTGVIWRLFSTTRYEERDGGVYIEIEAIALSRDVPASLRWLVDPIIRRVAKSSLTTTLEETRDAVHSNSGVRIARSK
jgi:hypothetical protein